MYYHICANKPPLIQNSNKPPLFCPKSPLFGAFSEIFWKFFYKPPSLNRDFFYRLLVMFELTVHLMKYN